MANNAVRLIAPVVLGALILLFPADGLRALGLGEARVDSWLGQPLDASIRLLEIEGEAIESVSVGPASLEDFERLGMPSDALALGLEVTIDRSTQPPIVHLNSQRPANDPIIQVLLDARWSNGRVLREYTLFLDPPVVDSAPPARELSEASQGEDSTPATPAEGERESAPVTSGQQPVSDSSQQAGTGSAAPATRGADSIQVHEGDTLWSIAQNWRPDSGLSMDQVMLAIFNRNRDAFLGENINRLRSDTQLDMPAVDELRSVDRAEAERRVREHMRSWEPAVSEDLPVVSDAATPEAPAPAEPEAADVSEPAESAEPDSAEEDFRLDVVPPEEDGYSESSAVADEEVREARSELNELESDIIMEGFANEAFDDHVAEIRDALDQRDMAGLAVAEESLAELEARLREAREARAEQESLAQTGAASESTDSGGSERIDEYMSELEERFQSGDAEDELALEEDGAGDEPAADADMQGPLIEEAADADVQDEQQAAAEPSDEPAAAERPEPAASSTSGGLSAWLWPLLGLMLVVALAAAALIWLRGRRADEPDGLPGVEDDAVETARKAVARDPQNLEAHLALLKLLADRDQEQAFTDAFDQMYQVVDDESADEWQEALTLASTQAPDHPLLTTSEGDYEDDFDRRADEMLGMLDVDVDEEKPGAEAPDSVDDSRDFEPGSGEDDDTDAAFDEQEAQARDEYYDVDTDLAVLSERLDEKSEGSALDSHSGQDDENVSDFNEFRELDEYSLGGAAERESDEHPEAPVTIGEEQADEPDLDLDTAQEQESDEVFGEAGTRDDEALEFDLDSDFGIDEPVAADQGFEFDLDDEDENTAASGGSQTEAAEPPAEDEFEFELPPAEAPSAGADPGAPSDAALTDEDADVKLDLARAYLSVDLADSARAVLDEVISDGSDAKREEARELLDGLE